MGVPHVAVMALVVAVCLVASPVSAANKTHYRAAVVAHWVDGAHDTTQAMLLANLKRYNDFCRESGTGKGEADIIAFPETGTGYLLVPGTAMHAQCEPVPALRWSINHAACDGSIWNATANTFGTYGLHSWWASCAARAYKLHIVVNMCEHNVSTGKYYNTNLAYSPDGELLAVYHKTNIADSGPYIDQPRVPDPVTFDTSFGVRFGLFTCFDLWFQQPMKDEIEKQRAYDFIYPEGMSSPTPMFRIPDVQNAWSLAHNVTLISSSLFGTSGSGAFVRGTPVAINQPDPDGAYTLQRVVFADIPILNRVGPHHPPSVSKSIDRSSLKPAPIRQTIRGTAPVERRREDFMVPRGVDCGGGPLACQEFYPFRGVMGPNGHRRATLVRRPEGVSYLFQLEAAHTGLKTAVHCTATVLVPGEQVFTVGTTRWVLAALSYTTVPSVGTPNGVHFGGCLVMQCPNATNMCQFHAMTDGFRSSLKATEVTVKARFSGDFNATNTTPFPFVGLMQGNRTNYVDLPVPAADLQFSTPTDGNATYAVGSQNLRQDAYLFSAGVYASAFYQTFQP